MYCVRPPRYELTFYSKWGVELIFILIAITLTIHRH